VDVNGGGAELLPEGGGGIITGAVDDGAGIGPSWMGAGLVVGTMFVPCGTLI